METHRDERFREFVLARYPSLVRLGYLLVADRAAAEDLVQTSLARTYRRWESINPEGAEAYVRQVLLNAARDWWRRYRREPLTVTLLDADLVAADRTGEVERRDALWRALQELPRGMRAVLVLRYYEDLTEADIAAVLGCSTGTVKAQASRGLARLRRAMDAQVAEEAW